MSLLRFLQACMLVLAIAGAAQAQGLVPVPPLTGHLTDQAGMLSAEQRARLEAVLTDYETKTGSQIAVLTVKTTAPEQIEQYSIRVADAWKLGRKGIDDGVLLLVAPGNTSAMRRLRIEAGRGVQGVLTDAKSKQVLQDVIAPHFRQEQYYDGLVAGVGAIATLLNAEKFPAPPQTEQAQSQADEAQASDYASLLAPLAFIAFMLILMKSRGGGAHRLGSNGWGSGAAGFIIGSVLSNAGRGGGGGFSGGGGGFSDGGGFSGGGGSFDGGGASGDW